MSRSLPPPLFTLLCLAGCGGEPAAAPEPDPVTATLPAVPSGPAVLPDAPPPPVDARPADPPLPDDAALAAAGLTALRSPGFTLVTDVPDHAAGLPEAVAAVRPEWAARLSPPPPGGHGAEVPITAFLMAEPDRFRAAGLFPDDLPPFVTGRQRGRRIWMYDGDEAYFRTALALHEATHVAMTADRNRGAARPLWYLEGMAELFGAHAVDPAGRWTFRQVPGPNAAAGGWDRIGQVRAAADAGRPLSIAEVRRLTDADFLAGPGYAWAWALCAFLDGHPVYGERFAALAGERGDRFDGAAAALFAGPDARELEARWRSFAAELVPGYRHPLVPDAAGPDEPLTAPRTVALDPRAGWTRTGAVVRRGDRVRVTATADGDGLFVLGRIPDGLPRAGEPIRSTPDGISLDRHRGRRVGEVQAAVLAAAPAPPGGLEAPLPVGSAGEFVAPRDGVVYVRVNDRPDSRADNGGRLSVLLAPAG